MDRYIALIHHDPKAGTYGISFPDFPGCVSASDTFEDAIAKGTEALALHVDLMRDDGDIIPAPRDLAEIKAAAEDWIEWEDAVVTAIPLIPLEGKAVRLNITLDEGLVREIDAISENRSGFLAEAAMGRLASRSLAIGRNAATGRLTTVGKAQRHPSIHVGRVPKKDHGSFAISRNAMTGELTPARWARSHPTALVVERMPKAGRATAKVGKKEKSNKKK